MARCGHPREAALGLHVQRCYDTNGVYLHGLKAGVGSTRWLRLTSRDPSPHGGGPRPNGDTEEGFCQDVSFADGRATFVPCLSGPQRPFIEGVHDDVRVLLERGDLRWPDLWETLEPVGA